MPWRRSASTAVPDEGSETTETPSVRMMSETQLLRPSCRRRRKTLKMAVVRICQARKTHSVSAHSTKDTNQSLA